MGEGPGLKNWRLKSTGDRGFHRNWRSDSWLGRSIGQIRGVPLQQSLTLVEVGNGEKGDG